MTYKVSERPGNGTYECNYCGQDLNLENDDDPLPPCARCERGTFIKV